MSSRTRNISNSNRTTSVNSHIDLIATEKTLLKLVEQGASTATQNVSDALSHTKLDDVISAISGISLDYTTDSVSVQKPVTSVVYDLELLSALMYADSANFSVGSDPYGRPGWYGTNSATTGASNCYWYSSVLVPQNEMTKAQVECIYTIIALDRVHPDVVLPFTMVYSKATGVDDYIPGFAHSSWAYVIPTTHVLNIGEVVMLTIGDHTKVANIRPELRRIHLELATSHGSALDTEVVAFMSLNTDSNEKPAIGSVQYLLQNAGFYYSVTESVLDYEFNNSSVRQIESNLLDIGSINTEITGLNGKIYNATETDVEAIKVYTVNGSGGSGGLVQLQAYSGTDWENLKSTTGALNTTDGATTSLDGKIHSATEVDTDAIKVYTVNSSGATIQAVLPNNPTVAVPLSASTYNDGTYDHYPLEVYNTNTLAKMQAYNTSTSAYEDLYTTASGHLLKVQACAHDYSGQDIGSTVVATVRGLNVKVVDNPLEGTYGNIHTGTLALSATSTPVAINNLYLNESVLTYEDTSTSITSNINILVSNNGTDYVVIGTIQPVTTIAGKRTASAILKMRPFTHVYIQNNNATTGLTGIVCSLFSA